MPLPGNVSTVTVHGKYMYPDGTAAIGTVSFSQANFLRDPSADVVIVPQSVTATLNGTGEFTAVLVATDDPDLDPTGWTYAVTESIGGQNRTYQIVLPAGSSTVEIADLAPATGSADIAWVYVRESTKGQPNGVASLDGTGKVPLTQIPASSGVQATRAINTGTGLTGGGDLSADRTLSVVPNTVNQKVEVRDAGVSIGTRKTINFVDGTAFSFTVQDDSANDRVNITGSAIIPSATGYATVQDEGTSRTARSTINFIGTGVSAVDDAANSRTNVTIDTSATSGYNTVQDEGTARTQRTNLNFVGAGVSVSDDSANGRTNVSISGATVAINRPMHLLVASSEAPQAFKDGADYVCDGTADQAEINAALARAARLPSRSGPTGAEQQGKVTLSGGRFNLTGSALMYSGEWLVGQGALTELLAVNLTASTGAGSAPALIKKASADEHLLRVSHMFLNGNSASGGATCHGIYFEGAGGVNSGYPDSSPDSDNWISDLWIRNFTTGTRHGVWISTSTGTAVERGSIIGNLQIRVVSGDAIIVDGASDCRIYECHIGGATRYGVNASGGNTEIVGVKTYFCDTAGFLLASGRTQITGCATQDCEIGFLFNGSPSVGTGLVADTSNAAGIQVSTDRLVLTGFSIFNRGGGRYATQQRGLWFDLNTYADNMIIGQIDDPSITSRIVGTPGSRSFMRVSDGVSLVTFG